MFWSLRLGSHDHISPVGRAVHRECQQLSSCDTRTSATDISLRKHFCLLRNNITQLAIVTASLNTQIEQRGADEKGREVGERDGSALQRDLDTRQTMHGWTVSRHQALPADQSSRLSLPHILLPTRIINLVCLWVGTPLPNIHRL